MGVPTFELVKGANLFETGIQTNGLLYCNIFNFEYATTRLIKNTHQSHPCHSLQPHFLLKILENLPTTTSRLASFKKTTAQRMAFPLFRELTSYEKVMLWNPQSVILSRERAVMKLWNLLVVKVNRSVLSINPL